MRYDVLLVEDNIGDARLVREAAREMVTHELVFEHADTLERGLALLGTRSFDAILTDLALPDSFGSETVEALHAAAPTTPIGINLPNSDWIRRAHGSKSVSLANVVAAYNAVRGGAELLSRVLLPRSD